MYGQRQLNDRYWSRLELSLSKYDNGLESFIVTNYDKSLRLFSLQKSFFDVVLFRQTNDSFVSSDESEVSHQSTSGVKLLKDDILSPDMMSSDMVIGDTQIVTENVLRKCKFVSSNRYFSFATTIVSKQLILLDIKLFIDVDHSIGKFGWKSIMCIH